MLRHGIPIQEVTLPRDYDADIIFMSTPGEVPEIEVREACIYCNYNYSNFLELEPWDRALCVAQYRLHHLIEQHANSAAQEAATAKTRTG